MFKKNQNAEEYIHTNSELLDPTMDIISAKVKSSLRIS